MKNKLFLSLSLLVTTQCLFAQNEQKVSDKLREMNSDTIRYMKEQILARKVFYMGKPLDSLLKDLPMPIKEYSNSDNPKNRFITESTGLYFYSYRDRIDRITKKQNPLQLTIIWESPIDFKELSKSGLLTFGDKWTEATNNFFKNKIIREVKMQEYNF